ncbi:MAG: quinol monooxygenase YgiN [Bacteroidia bacterium]|jgi:quinol monooxygenase YgiN
MLIRIVRMTFQPDKVGEFLEIFEGVKSKIRAFEGCEYLELWQDADHPNICLTHSHWTGKKDLENYRHSELFKATWAKTKPMFADKPMAFSVNSVTKLP